MECSLTEVHGLEDDHSDFGPAETRWAEAPGFPGYQVSDAGDVRGIHGHRLKPLSGGTSPYPRVVLRGKNVRIHSLVAAAFIGPRPSGMEVDHVNGDVFDFRASNLEYVTPEVNAVRYAERAGWLSSRPAIGSRSPHRCGNCGRAGHYKPTCHVTTVSK